MEYLSQHLLAVSVISSIAALVLFTYLVRTNYLWLDHWYSLPVIGTISRIAKDTTRYAANNDWTNSERRLCHDYKQFFTLTTADKFQQNILYLKKAQDLGRSPLKIWLAALLAMLVVAEGLGFSYLLGTWMATEGSESTRQMLMFGIVFVLCVILVLITHAAGHQLYRSSLLVGCNKEWRDDGQEGSLSHNVALNDDQHADDAMKSYTQCASRVAGSGSVKPSYLMVYIAAVVIVVIAFASTWMRYQHLEAATIKETANLSHSVASVDSSNPFASGLPSDVVQVQSEADKKAIQEQGAATNSEGLAAFVMLGFIFVVTQIVGIFAGYKYGFAGKESKEAYRLTSGLSTYDSLVQRMDPVAQVARAALQHLQQKMAEQQSNKSLRLSKTFDEYLVETQKNNLSSMINGGEAQDKPVASAVAPQQANASVAMANSNSVIANHVEKIEAMGPGEDRQAYLAALPTAVLSEVQAMRKANKEAGAEDAKRRAELLSAMED